MAKYHGIAIHSISPVSTGFLRPGVMNPSESAFYDISSRPLSLFRCPEFYKERRGTIKLIVFIRRIVVSCEFAAFHLTRRVHKSEKAPSRRHDLAASIATFSRTTTITFLPMCIFYRLRNPQELISLQNVIQFFSRISSGISSARRPQ